MLEFVIMQVKKLWSLPQWKYFNMFLYCANTVSILALQSQALSKGKVLGRVRIGAEAADAGRAHWRDVCNLQVEQVRWHTVQPEPL